MTITVSKQLEFDEEKERKRLIRCFKGATLARQLPILDAFVQGDFEEVIRLFNALPRSKKHECPEQEYVCMFIYDFLRDYYSDNKWTILLDSNAPSNLKQSSEILGCGGSTGVQG
jgi:hypothetical protein